MYNLKKVETNINKYSYNELVDILLALNINITNITSKTAFIEQCKVLIKQYSKQKTKSGNDLVLFLKNIMKDKRIISSIEKGKNTKVVNTKNEYSEQNKDNSQVNKWWTKASLSQDNPQQTNKITDRKQKIDIYDNVHTTMKRQQLGINQNIDLPIVQGTLNPKLTNLITKSITIDSQFRKNNFPIIDLKYNDITNHHTSIYSSTDFIANLTDSLLNVINIRLYEVTIPYSWYEIDHYNNNTFFVIKYNDDEYFIDLTPGNYQYETDNSTDINNIYAALNTAIKNEITSNYCDGSGTNFGFTYNLLTGKTIFISDTTDVSLIWYSSTNSLFKNINYKVRSNNNLGYNLGYRNSEYDYSDYSDIYNTNDMYTISFTDGTDDVTISGYLYILESEGIIDLYGTKYLLLSIDDYNNNYSNKSMISIENKNLGLDKSIFNNISETTSKVFINDSNSYYHQLIDRNESRTQAQIDSINNISKIRSTVYNDKNPSISIGHLFAIIPIKRSVGTTLGEGLIEFSGSIQVNKREYFGPVDITKLHIRLYNDKGNVLNLNGRDWSFT